MPVIQQTDAEGDAAFERINIFIEDLENHIREESWSVGSRLMIAAHLFDRLIELGGGIPFVDFITVLTEKLDVTEKYHWYEDRNVPIAEDKDIKSNFDAWTRYMARIFEWISDNAENYNISLDDMCMVALVQVVEHYERERSRGVNMSDLRMRYYSFFSQGVFKEQIK